MFFLGAPKTWVYSVTYFTFFSNYVTYVSYDVTYVSYDVTYGNVSHDLYYLC